VRKNKDKSMPGKSVVLINLLKVEPEKQAALVALLRENIETVVSTLAGWSASHLIAASDGTSVVIYSEWKAPAAVEAMRNDPRMQACFPKILELASFESVMGESVASVSR
jgi:quinol monooxygenase YgiN